MTQVNATTDAARDAGQDDRVSFHGRNGTIIDRDANERGACVFVRFDDTPGRESVFSQEEADRDLRKLSDMRKTVEFAYASSDNAKRFGYAREGCWCVEVGFPGEVFRAIEGHPTREQAMRRAKAFSIHWSDLFLRLNPAERA